MKHVYPFGIVLILLFALLLRLIALWAWSKTPFWQIPVADERIYHDWASLIATGQYNPQSAYEFSPLPAYFFALVYSAFDISALVIRLTNILLNLATLFLIAEITRKLSGKRTALIALAVSAGYLPFIFYSVTCMKTGLSIFLFALFLYTLLHAIKRKRLCWFLFLGMVTSLCIQTRGNYLVLTIIGLLAAFIEMPKSKLGTRKWGAALCFILGTLFITVPVVMRNAPYDSKLVLSTTQGGFNFYLGNHHLYDAPWSRPTQFAAPDPYVQAHQFTIEAHRQNPAIQSAGDTSTFWYRAALKEMLAEPVKTFKKTCLKCLAVFHHSDACDHFNLKYLRPFIPEFFSLPFLTFSVIFPFGMAGLLLSFRQREYRWITLTVLAYAGTLILFFSNGRYRLPLMVCLIPAAAAGLYSTCSALRNRTYRKPVYFFALCFCFLILEYIPLKGDSDMSAYRVNHGIVLDIAGKKDEAQKRWIETVREGGDFTPSACIELAKADCRNGRLLEAEAWLNQIPDDSYAYASRLALLAQIRVIQHRFNEAEQLLQESLAVNSGDLQVRELLIGVLQQTSPQEAIEELETQEYLHSFYRGF